MMVVIPMKIFLNTINDDGRTVENYRPVDELVGILSTNISKTNDQNKN